MEKKTVNREKTLEIILLIFGILLTLVSHADTQCTSTTGTCSGLGEGI